jgi:hypothetical protein
MVLTYPIYSGSNNINEYFLQNNISTIDIKYPKTAIAKIKKLIADNSYEKSLDQLLQMRDLVMDEYNMFNLIHKITKKDQESGLNIDKKQLIKIRKEKFFILQTSSSVTKSRKNLIQRIKNSLNKKVRKIKNYFIDYLLLIKFKVG